MKFICWCVALVFCCSVLGPAQDVFTSPVGSQNRAPVIEITKQISSRVVTHAAFRQEKQVLRIARTFVSTGTMIFDATRGLLWETVTPFPGALVMTQDRVAQKSASGKISTLALGNNDTFKRFAGVVQAIFHGDYAAIETDFDVYFLPGPEARWSIGLVPKDRTIQSVIASMEIHGGIDLDGFVLKEANGDSVTYTFSDITHSDTLSAADEQAFF